MNKTVFACAFLIGSLPPVAVVVWFGLINEGFLSLAFLFPQGPETWLQIALLGLFVILLLPVLRPPFDRVARAVRRALFLVLVTGLAGLALTSAVLYIVGIGEMPWRKFYTYWVAPRAVSAWLCASVVTLLLGRRQSAQHAA
jgi:hypothetical protein